MTTYTYTVNCIDSDRSATWMDIATTARPGGQDGGRVWFAITVEAARVAELEAALESDPDVVSYEDTTPDVTSAPTKAGAGTWETVATYIATYPDGNDEGSCEVSVQVAKHMDSDVWFVRTADDAGGSDDYDDTTYPSRAAAVMEARAFAAARDESAE